MTSRHPSRNPSQEDYAATTMLAAIWILAALGIIAWSFVAWGMHQLLTLDPQWVGDLEPLIDRIPYSEWIERWAPGWRELLRTAIEFTQAMLEWVGDAAPWVVIIVWAAGAMSVVGVAGLLTLLVVVLRRNGDASAQSNASPR